MEIVGTQGVVANQLSFVTVVRTTSSDSLYSSAICVSRVDHSALIADARAELPARTSKIDVILNAQFISRYHAEFIASR
ncbi:MAG: hypothetical protein WB586_04705 [Chthoniobacterales bacterium]